MIFEIILLAMSGTLIIINSGLAYELGGAPFCTTITVCLSVMWALLFALVARQPRNEKSIMSRGD